MSEINKEILVKEATKEQLIAALLLLKYKENYLHDHKSATKDAIKDLHVFDAQYGELIEKIYADNRFDQEESLKK